MEQKITIENWVSKMYCLVDISPTGSYSNCRDFTVRPIVVIIVMSLLLSPKPSQMIVVPDSFLLLPRLPSSEIENTYLHTNNIYK